MIFNQATLDRIVSGDITLAFRTWTTPRARVGGTQMTQRGIVEFTSVKKVSRVTKKDALSAGYSSVDEVTRWLGKKPGDMYRVGLRFVGADPRHTLRESVDPTGLAAALSKKPWAADVLRAIRDRPGEVSTTIAPDFGWERQSFKNRVRQLKTLGLTESLEVGYRISPRGAAYLASIE